MRGLFVNFWGAHLSVLSSSSSMAGEAAVPAWPELAGDADRLRRGRRARALPTRPLDRSSPAHGRATDAGEGAARRGGRSSSRRRPCGGEAVGAGAEQRPSAALWRRGGQSRGRAAPVGGLVAARRSEQGRSSARRLGGGAAPVGVGCMIGKRKEKINK
jgi:hypothetical protein